MGQGHQMRPDAGSEERLEVVRRTEHLRLGICSSEGGPVRIELLVCLLPHQAPVDIRRLRAWAEVLQDIWARGFTLFHREDGWVVCEKSVSGEEAGAECTEVLGLVLRRPSLDVDLTSGPRR